MQVRKQLLTTILVVLALSLTGSFATAQVSGKSKWILNPDDAVLLLLDHQSGLFQLVHDIEQAELRNNVIALAKVAYLTKMPTFTTASVPDGPNGPLIPEIHQVNPDAVYIARTGQINAWDNPDWVKAIKNTNRKTLIIAGTLTSVCMALPAFSAIEEGYTVYCVIDASGNRSKMSTDITIARIVQAGVRPIDTFAVISEIMITWNRPDAANIAGVAAEYVLPGARLLMESYGKAQSVQRDGHETKLDKVQPAK